MSGDSGWNAVIHHPSELELQNWNWDENDDEGERELPSTVDMDAIKGGGSWDPATARNDTDSVDSEEDSDSDEDSSGGTEESCSYSDSESENDSSAEEDCADTGSNTDCSSENSEQTFSIRETNFEQGALKLKISMKAQKKEEVDKTKCEKPRRLPARNPKGPNNNSAKSGEYATDDSNSSGTPSAANSQEQTSQQAASGLGSATTTATTSATTTTTTSTTTTSSASTTSTSSTTTSTVPSTQPQSQQQPLQEINQEDLAAILPDQEHEDAPFDGFEDSESGRMVSKAIERMSLGADSDSSEATDANPVPVYSSTLLQQFVEKTALLSEPRKRRSKLVKKPADAEYACVSNVSPDSGIQSVDNSPLHLAASPTSQLAASQSPVQTSAPTKPAVNVDRVLYPPKRKPGRPAKMVSTQPRGPGRPRLRPEVVEKIEKIERSVEQQPAPNNVRPKKAEPADTKSTKNNIHEVTAKATTNVTANKNPQLSPNKSKRFRDKKSTRTAHESDETKSEDKPRTENRQAEDTSETRSCCEQMTKKSNQSRDRSAERETSKKSKEKLGNSNKASAPIVAHKTSRREQTQAQHQQEERCTSNGRKSTKENRATEVTSTLGKKVFASKKCGQATITTGTTTTATMTTTTTTTVATGARRVLKENKSSKKSAGRDSETNVVGVQTVISLPVVSPLKSENIEIDAYKCEKTLQITQNNRPISHHHHHNHRHHHHHKHRRRVIVPPKRPIKINPVVSEELEKLIDEFARSCNLGRNNSSIVHSELPQIFRVKKMIKKRKGSDGNASEEQKLKRRLKKEKLPANGDSKSGQNNSSSSNSNEQRLPLKKRHYHVSSPHSSQSSSTSGNEISSNETNATDNHIEEAIEATITRYSENLTNNNQRENVPVTPKKRHRDTEVTSVEAPINESCESADEKPANRLEIQPRRKKKIVKDLRVTVTKLSSENHVANDKSDKIEAHPNETKSLKSHPEKLLKSEKSSAAKSDKAQPPKTDKSSLVKTDKALTEKSIKVDKVVVELAEKAADSAAVTLENSRDKNNAESCDTKPTIVKIPDTRDKRNDPAARAPSPVRSSITATILTKKKIRRRKPINRTGFPTLKKKKKKIPPVEHVENGDDEGKLKVIRRTDAIEKSIVTEMKVSNDDKDVLTESEIQAVIPIVKETSTEHQTLEKVDEKITYKDYDECNDPPILEEDASRINHCDGTGHSRSSGKLRVRKDLVECDGSRPCDKLCPVKFEKIQDSRMYDENATLEESLERYNQSQRVAELSVENVKKLDRASNNDPSNVKLEISACLNNNHKRRRGSTSPCNVTLRNIKRLRSAGYDTESDALPSSDVASDETEIGKQLGSTQIKRKQPRWKKRYLQAGLFSDYYKEDEPRRVTNSENSAGKNKMIYDSAEHPHGLLPPPYHCGKFLRQRKIHFQLPYDLWWLHTHSRLPGRDLVPSWNYRKIRTNIYFDVKPTTLYEAQSCECNPESGCGDECINRMVFSECSPHFCPCSERCSNQKIQRHEWAPGLQRFMTDCKGWGIRTKDSIKMGDFILEYVGEVVSEREFKSRMATRYANDTHHYCLHLDGGLVIDGHRMGGDGRFVNHSCEPNCEMQKWSVHGLPRMALFASRNIIPGEELTYDYNFALFNPSEGQQCRCGSEVCRGVIGGKSQRVARCLPITPAHVDTTERRSVGRPRKNVRKSIIVQSSNSKGLCKTRKIGDSAIIHAPSIKPMSHQQRCFAQQHHCFLLRNLEKVRRLKAPTSNSLQAQSGKGKDKLPQTLKEKNLVDSKTQSDAFYSQLTALNNVTCRTVRTRRLAQAQDDPEVNKTAKLAKVLKNLYDVVATANDENCQLLCSPFVSLPPKRKLPEYYEKIVDPIDLTMIEQAVSTGQYKLAEQFDQDMIKLFDNNVKFFGRTSELGIAAARLRKLYLGSKADFIEAITEATGSPPAHGFLPPQGSTAGEEDVIRCICGLHRDEGLMIQCERCLVWQHCDCVKADTSAESYLCERCQPRKVDLEIPLEGEEEEEGKKQYVTLLRGDLQLRQGDTVYVLRDTPEKHTYKTIQKPDYEEMDIFRIERLWKNAQGERFVFGHHYLRPHETYHEPTRKFYENEVVCAPLYEAVPCDLVAERCWVLDPNTYCKGRPVCSTPEHTYVCEYRVDRAARLFTKVARARHQVCVKPYAFEVFPERIKHYRTYLPHSLEGVELGSSKVSKDKKKPPTQEVENNSAGDATEATKINGKDQSKSFSSRTRRRSCDTSVVTTFAMSSAQKDTQRKRLNTILLSLLQRMPNKKDPLDLSFLLDRNRRNRKRTGNLNP